MRRSRKGFTLIELMVVVLIVAVLAAVLIPMLQARVEAAKWSEGKAGCGTIATAIRAYAAENGDDGDYTALTGTTGVAILFKASDLHGKYFVIGDYSISEAVSYDGTADPALTYEITVSAPSGAGWKVASYTLDEAGEWTETAATSG